MHEFAARQALDLNDNIDMQLLVRRKPFKDEKQQAINDVDADSDQEPREKNFETEFLGGEAGSDASEVDELEDDVVESGRRKPLVPLALAF